MKMTKCPHCGGGIYYTRDYAYGHYNWYSNFDGSDIDNSGWDDNLQVNRGKVAYCADCNKRLGRVTDIEGESK